MTKRKYKKGSHIDDKKVRLILKYFAMDLTAEAVANLTSISRPTINKYFLYFRKAILDYLVAAESKDLSTYEIDESYFGARRVRGKRGRGASGKIPVFGLLKRPGNQVNVQIVANCSRAELLPIIKGKIIDGSTIYSDGWKAYNNLVLNGYKHHRIFHHANEFARGKNHVNGIESFWSFAKRRLSKFNGIRDYYFILHLKESEFRWNFKNKNIYKVLTNLIANFNLKVI